MSGCLVTGCVEQGWKEELNRQEETFEGDGHVQVMNNGFIDICQKS